MVGSALMHSRARFAVMMLAMAFALSTCSVSLAGAEPMAGDVCTAMKTSVPGVAASPLNAPAIVVEPVALAPPDPAPVEVPTSPVGLPHGTLVEPRAPRAPPTA